MVYSQYITIDKSINRWKYIKAGVQLLYLRTYFSLSEMNSKESTESVEFIESEFEK